MISLEGLNDFHGLDFANAKSGDGDEFVISYSSFIVRSLAILLSLRGAK